MSDSEPTLDAEFERLKKRRLDVLNSAPKGKTEAFSLEAEGTAPEPCPASTEALQTAVIDAIRTVYDPEIPLNIYDLGLVYNVNVSEDFAVHVQMTLTAPGCPVAGSLVKEVQDRVRQVPGVRHSKTELVWDPPWSRERMSFEARLELGLL